MHTLISVNAVADIPPELRDTPVGKLLEYNNLGRAFEVYQQAQLLIGMCMDNRKHLRIPDNFAFIIRAGGANLRPAAFKVSYAIAVGGVRAIALIGHNDCGMSHIDARREQFVNGLVENAGWDRERALDHFLNLAPLFEIGNERAFVVAEAHRLRREYPKVLVVPMIYGVEDSRLYLLKEDAQG